MAMLGLMKGRLAQKVTWTNSAVSHNTGTGRKGFGSGIAIWRSSLAVNGVEFDENVMRYEANHGMSICQGKVAGNAVSALFDSSIESFLCHFVAVLFWEKKNTFTA